MFRPLRVLGLLALIGSLSAASLPLVETLQTLAAREPEARFSHPESLSPEFTSFLSKRGVDPEALTNKGILELCRESGFCAKTEAPPAPARRPQKLAASAAKVAALTGEDAGGRAVKDPEGAFDGRAAAAPEKEKSDPPGLRFFGIDIGGGQDKISDDSEPYLRKGLPHPFDWDLRARVDLDGLGATAKYRHPGSLRSLNVGFLKYFDLPKTLGAGGLRDGAYRMVGQTPERPLGGFELGVSGAINQYVGGATTYDHKEAQKRDRWTGRTRTEAGLGYSPLGDNPGKAWNYTLLASLMHETLSVRQPGYAADKSGVGYSLGVAYQHALHEVPVMGKARNPGSDSSFWLDRLKARVGMRSSAVSSTSFNAAAEVSIYLFKHLEITPGITATVIPSPDVHNPDEKAFGLGAKFGLDLHY